MTEATSKRTNRTNKIKGFQVIEDECIWMKAGVVNYRVCDNAFDCYTCAFDTGMRKAMGLNEKNEKPEKGPGWAAELRKRYRGTSRPCRHALTGRISDAKICTMNYECYHCPFDQMLDDMDYSRSDIYPSYQKAAGFRMADGYYYHMGHSWSRFEHGGRVRVGFDDFLVRVFGSVHALALPPLGGKVKQNEVGWTFNRDDREGAVMAPVTGTVLAVNHKAMEHPDITHEDPYNEGWLFILEPEAPKKNLKSLYFGNESLQWMEQESQRLMELLGPEYVGLAATGGGAVDDVFGYFPEIGWDLLVNTFLHTKK